MTAESAELVSGKSGKGKSRDSITIKSNGADVNGDQERKQKKERKESNGVADSGEKKKKRKRKDADADGTRDAPKTEKKRPRKSEEDETDAAAASIAPEREAEAETETARSDKTKKRKKQRDANTDADADAAPEKPKKKKTNAIPSDPSSSSFAAAVDASPASASDAAAYLDKHSITITVPPGAEPVLPVLTFSQLPLPAPLRVSLAAFKEPTPIQACAWPPALAGRDVVGIAETGSGKTLAFGLPALAHLTQSSPSSSSSKSKSKSKSKSANAYAGPISVLVLAPTRELALQTHDTLTELGAPFALASVAVFGGVDKGPQKRALAGAGPDAGGRTTRMVVGTPGRVLDLINEGVCDLSHVTYLVLDEADRMLDKGFENDIRNIISYTVQGAGRQTLMFSATWPESVRRLASTFQQDPVRVTVGSDDLTANSRVEQVIDVFDDARSKDSRLLDQLRTLRHSKVARPGQADNTRILVFVLYKKEAARVEGMLRGKGFSVEGIHGDMAQAGRMTALQRFKDGESNTLVATDVAARGLDIPNVAVVINYSFPLTIEDYIHRIGRTGRGGRTGKSVTFFTGDNHERALAGELARVLHESGFDAPGLNKFPMTIKKKTHGVYGAFFRDDIAVPTGPTKIKF